jgi:hypothetical protein
MVDVSIGIAAVVRLSRDTHGRFDRTLEEARTVLAAIQTALEGQSFDYLELPLFTETGPTDPEFFETEPAFAFTYLEMSGTKCQALYDALGLADFSSYDDGYVNENPESPQYG